MFNTQTIRTRIVRTKAATIADWYELDTAGGSWSLDASGASATAGTSNILQHLVGGFADQKVTAVVKTSTAAASAQFGVFVRMLTSKTSPANNTYYFLRFQTGTLRITKVVDGVFTNLASVAYTMTPGTEYTMTLQIVGNALTGTMDDLAGNSQTLTASDSAITGMGICGARSGPTNSTQISVKSIQTEEVWS